MIDDQRPRHTIIGLIITSSLVGLSLTSCFAQKLGGDSQSKRPRRALAHDSRAITVRTGEKLQPAIDHAKFGDTIILEAGATFGGPLVLPYKGPGTNTNADYITIRTSNLSGIPAEGERLRPSEHAIALPKISAPRGQSALATNPQAHHYRFIGVEFAPTADSDYLYNLISLGSDDYKSLSEFPHHLVFDRCYVHSTGLGKARRGFALNGGETWILNSHVSGFAGPGDETQAICGWAGPGPFHIINNYVEGGGQNIFFGGGDPSVKDVVPSDIEIRRNYIYKPSEWYGHATIKAMFEMKNVRRLTVDANVMESGGRTSAFALVVFNQGGTAPWSTIQDVVITNNVIRHMGSGFNISGRDPYKPSQSAKRIRIANNLVLDVGTDYSAFFVQTTAGDSLTVEHNTVQQTGNTIVAYGEPTTNFFFLNNIVQYNSYGVVCDGGAIKCFAPGAFRGNVVADNLNKAAEGYPIERYFPPGNLFPSGYDRLKFVANDHGNWRLATNSSYRGKATDGKDPGVDFDLLEASGVNSATSGSPFPEQIK